MPLRLPLLITSAKVVAGWLLGVGCYLDIAVNPTRSSVGLKKSPIITSATCCCQQCSSIEGDVM